MRSRGYCRDAAKDYATTVGEFIFTGSNLASLSRMTGIARTTLSRRKEHPETLTLYEAYNLVKARRGKLTGVEVRK